MGYWLAEKSWLFIQSKFSTIIYLTCLTFVSPKLTIHTQTLKVCKIFYNRFLKNSIPGSGTMNSSVCQTLGAVFWPLDSTAKILGGFNWTKFPPVCFTIHKVTLQNHYRNRLVFFFSFFKAVKILGSFMQHFLLHAPTFSFSEGKHRTVKTKPATRER